MEETVKQALTDNIQYMNMRELNELIRAYQNNTFTLRQAFLMGVILGGSLESELSSDRFQTIDGEKVFIITDFITNALK